MHPEHKIESSDETRQFRSGEILDVVVYDLKKYFDDRGWLAELFRHDELAEEFYPVMSYISFTSPGIQRGPHEHVDQADLFCFIGPSVFNLRLWDNRPESATYNNMMTLIVGEDDPKAVVPVSEPYSLTLSRTTIKQRKPVKKKVVKKKTK